MLIPIFSEYKLSYLIRYVYIPINEISSRIHYNNEWHLISFSQESYEIGIFFMGFGSEKQSKEDQERM